MKAFAIVSVACLTLMSTTLTGSIDPSLDVSLASGPSLTVDAARPSWPIVREPSGYWGVIGEAVARHSGAQPVAIRAVTFAVDGPGAGPLLRETFETDEALGQILVIYGRDASGALVPRPAGTTVMNPGDAAVVFLAGLTEPRSRPRRARVTMRFSHGPERRASVPLEEFEPGARMMWPLRLDSEPWLALNAPGTAHHWLGSTIPTERQVFSGQRFALDLVQIDANNERHPAGTSNKESYYAWGEEVLSTGRGRVIAVVNDQRDLEIGDEPSSTQHPGGNHVVIQHGRRLFGVYAHLQQGSATVNVGDWVERGQVLGLVGNSGNTTEPHLHVHFADRWIDSDNPLESLYFSQGVPAAFWGAQVFRDGQLFPLRGATPLEGDLVVNGSDVH